MSPIRQLLARKLLARKHKAQAQPAPQPTPQAQYTDAELQLAYIALALQHERYPEYKTRLERCKAARALRLQDPWGYDIAAKIVRNVAAAENFEELQEAWLNKAFGDKVVIDLE